jgi:hypothetical protein
MQAKLIRPRRKRRSAARVGRIEVHRGDAKGDGKLNTPGTPGNGIADTLVAATVLVGTKNGDP